MNPADEKSLLAAARSGDRRSFEQLVRTHQSRVYSLALRMLGNAADAEDVLQETFIALYKNLGRFQERSKLSTYLYRLAANFALMKLRHLRTHGGPGRDLAAAAEVPDAQPSPLEHAERRDLRDRLQRALLRLPPDVRAVLVLRDVEGLGGRETAQALKLSLPAMKSRLHRGREALRRMMLARTSLQGTR